MLMHQWHNGRGNDLGFGNATAALFGLGKEFLFYFNYTWKL